MSNGRIEVQGQVHTAAQYNIPYHALEKYLNGIDPKQMKNMSALDMCRKVFEFGFMYAALDKEDLLGRIANLNEQNLKWFTKADALEAECIQLRKQVASYSGQKELTLESQPSKETLSTDFVNDSTESESSLKKQEVSEDCPTSTDATEEVTSSLN